MAVTVTVGPPKPVLVSAPEAIQGRPGPPGPPGGNFVFVYTEPVASQVIDHNLGFFPNVSATDTVSGRNVNVGYVHHSENQIEIQTLTPMTLRVRLS